MNAWVSRSEWESLQVSIGCRRLLFDPRCHFKCSSYAKETCDKDPIAGGHIAHVNRIRHVNVLISHPISVILLHARIEHCPVATLLLFMQPLPSPPPALLWSINSPRKLCALLMLRKQRSPQNVKWTQSDCDMKFNPPHTDPIPLWNVALTDCAIFAFGRFWWFRCCCCRST